MEASKAAEIWLQYAKQNMPRTLGNFLWLRQVNIAFREAAPRPQVMTCTVPPQEKDFFALGSVVRGIEHFSEQGHLKDLQAFRLETPKRKDIPASWDARFPPYIILNQLINKLSMLKNLQEVSFPCGHHRNPFWLQADQLLVLSFLKKLTRLTFKAKAEYNNFTHVVSVVKYLPVTLEELQLHTNELQSIILLSWLERLTNLKSFNWTDRGIKNKLIVDKRVLPQLEEVLNMGLIGSLHHCAEMSRMSLMSAERCLPFPQSLDRLIVSSPIPGLTDDNIQTLVNMPDLCELELANGISAPVRLTIPKHSNLTYLWLREAHENAVVRVPSTLDIDVYNVDTEIY